PAPSVQSPAFVEGRAPPGVPPEPASPAPGLAPPVLPPPPVEPPPVLPPPPVEPPPVLLPPPVEPPPEPPPVDDPWGVTGAEGAEAGLVPAVLVAVTVNV